MILLEIGKVITIMREKRNLSKKELGKLMHIDSSSVTRIESGKKNLTYEEIIDILSVMGITLTDFEYIRKSDSPLAFYTKEYHKSYDTDNNTPLIQSYRYFKNNKDSSLEHLIYYLKIKKFFGTTRPDIIPSIEKSDISNQVQLLMESRSYGQLDYEFLAAFSPEILLISQEHLETLFKKMLPVNRIDLYNKPVDMTIAVTQCLNNAVNHFLVCKDFTLAQIYLDYLTKHLDEFPLFDFSCFASTYQEIINFQEKNNFKHPLAVKEYIVALEALNLPRLSQALKEDYNNFFSGDDIDPLTQNNYIMN